MLVCIRCNVVFYNDESSHLSLLAWDSYWFLAKIWKWFDIAFFWEFWWSVLNFQFSLHAWHFLVVQSNQVQCCQPLSSNKLLPAWIWQLYLTAFLFLQNVSYGFIFKIFYVDKLFFYWWNCLTHQFGSAHTMLSSLQVLVWSHLPGKEKHQIQWSFNY